MSDYNASNGNVDDYLPILSALLLGGLGARYGAKQADKDIKSLREMRYRQAAIDTHIRASGLNKNREELRKEAELAKENIDKKLSKEGKAMTANSMALFGIPGAMLGAGIANIHKEHPNAIEDAVIGATLGAGTMYGLGKFLSKRARGIGPITPEEVISRNGQRTKLRDISDKAAASITGGVVGGVAGLPIGIYLDALRGENEQ